LYWETPFATAILTRRRAMDSGRHAGRVEDWRGIPKVCVFSARVRDAM
jgi:hypothetical protein